MGIKLDDKLKKYVKDSTKTKKKVVVNEMNEADESQIFDEEDNQFLEDMFLNQKPKPKKIDEVTENIRTEKFIVEKSELNDKILNKLENLEKYQKIILDDINSLILDKKMEVEISQSEIEKFILNLEIFNKKLIIVDNNFENPKLKEIIKHLEIISEHFFTNSFYIFSKNNYIIQKTKILLKELNIKNYEIDYYLVTIKNLLEKIENISQMDEFEKNYNYSQLLLEKGLSLNAITLLNETIGIYILESIKHFSKNIQKEIELFDDNYKLLSNSKEFFIKLFESKDNSLLTFFPNHKIPKDNDKDIIRKLLKLKTTWKNKGDDQLFYKFVYLIKSIRQIRNSLAHADMSFSFVDIKKEIEELNKDFYYIAVVKNILKR